MFEFGDLDLYDAPVAAPADRDVFIQLRDGRAMVTRCSYVADQVWTLDPCVNWQELEPASVDFVTKLTGSPKKHFELYPCPDRIALHAQWK